MKSILLVEDNSFIADIYSTKFKEAGFKVKIVKNGADVLRNLKEEKPDVLLLDIVLPELTGWEILRKIKKDRRLKDLKIVILSNLGQKEEVEKGLKLGAIKYLIKVHYTPSQVVKEIKEVLK